MSKLTNSKSRIRFFDIAKGVSIIAVVLGHIMPTDVGLNIFISSWHVPAFFIINGMLLSYTNYSEKSFTKILITGLMRLIIPYFCFGMLLLLTRWGFSGFDIFTLRWQLIDLLFFYGIGANWFLPAMFFAQVIYFITKRISLSIQTRFPFLKHRVLLTFIGLCFFSLPFAFSPELVIIKVLFRAFIGTFFIIIGDLTISIILKIKNSTSNKSKIFLFLICISFNVLVFILTNRQNVSLYLLKIGNPLIYFICAILGTLSLIFFSLIIEGLSDNNLICKILMFFGLQSLNIMGTHQALMLLLFIPEQENYLLNIALCIFILIAELPVIFIIKKITSLFKRKAV